MSRQSIKRAAIVGVLALLVAVAVPRTVRASNMIPDGFDLFDPLSGSRIDVPGLGLISVIGVPLGMFDFQGFRGVGVEATGNADSILHRRTTVTDTMPSTVIEMIAMQLMSDDASFFFTLQSARGEGDPPPGPASTGVMTLAFGPEPGPPPPPQPIHGTFTWFLDLFFDVRTGSLGGPILTSSMIRLTVDPDWSHFAVPGAVRIPGVNFRLNGTDESGDFWPIGVFSATGVGGTTVAFQTAVPEPAALLLLGLGLAAIAAVRNSRKRGKQAA